MGADNLQKKILACRTWDCGDRVCGTYFLYEESRDQNEVQDHHRC